MGWIFDNDGDIDLHVVNGGIQGNQGSILYENNGNVFLILRARYSEHWSDRGRKPEGDMIMMEIWISTSLITISRINCINNGNSNHWVIIKPVGTTSNRAGIGARIEVTTGTSARKSGWTAGPGFLLSGRLPGFSPAWVVSEEIDTLKINWPGRKGADILQYYSRSDTANYWE